MEYNIISKIEYIDGEVRYTPIGYTLDMNDVNIINNQYDNTLGLWVEENKTELENGTKSIGEFFSIVSIVYVARYITTSVEGMGLNDINVDELWQ
jgi:hypothetical protein